MKRFCSNCNKEFDFEINGMKDLENLVCPECGHRIGKNSRLVVDDTENEEKMLGFLGGVLTFFWFFYLIISLLGIGAYFLHWDKTLYVLTGIILCVYSAQMLWGSGRFALGLILIPAGAVAGYIYLKTVQGACFGVMAVFAARHIIRDVIWNLVMLIVRGLAKLGQ